MNCSTSVPPPPFPPSTPPSLPILPSLRANLSSGMSVVSGSTTTPVISLFKLKNFVYRPKLKPFPSSTSQTTSQQYNNPQQQQPQQNQYQNNTSSNTSSSESNIHFENNLQYENHSIVSSQPSPHPTASNGPTGDENRIGLDSSVHHSLYGSHATGRLINSGGGGGNAGATGASGHGGHGGGQSMLIMSQPMKSLSSSNTSNGTGRKYQCKMCPQVRSGFKNWKRVKHDVNE